MTETTKQRNDRLWNMAVDIVKERIANNPSIPEEARRMLIKEVYKELK